MFFFFLQLWFKPDKARTSRGRNNIVYRVHFPRCAFCVFSPLCILGFKKFTSSLKCSQLSEPSDQQETLFDFPIAKVGQNEKVDTTYGESAPLPKEPEGSFPKMFSVPGSKVYCCTIVQVVFPFGTSIRYILICVQIWVVTLEDVQNMCKAMTSWEDQEVLHWEN